MKRLYFEKGVLRVGVVHNEELMVDGRGGFHRIEDCVMGCDVLKKRKRVRVGDDVLLRAGFRLARKVIPISTAQGYWRVGRLYKCISNINYQSDWGHYDTSDLGKMFKVYPIVTDRPIPNRYIPEILLKIVTRPKPQKVERKKKLSIGGTPLLTPVIFDEQCIPSSALNNTGFSYSQVASDSSGLYTIGETEDLVVEPEPPRFEELQELERNTFQNQLTVLYRDHHHQQGPDAGDTICVYGRGFSWTGTSWVHSWSEPQND